MNFDKSIKVIQYLRVKIKEWNALKYIKNEIDEL